MRFNRYKSIIIFLIFCVSGCTSVKETLSSVNKKNTDEFMVRKKDPLVMPPNYNDLPKPQAQVNKDKNDNENINFSEVLDNKNIKKEKIKKSKGTLEKSISNILNNK